LTARAVAAAGPGRHHDGGGLYLLADERGRRWVLLYTFAGRRREMGLGSADPHTGVSLAKAREAARQARDHLAEGVDPITARRASRDGPPVVFGAFATNLGAKLAEGWDDKTLTAWTRWVAHASSVAMTPVDQVDTDAVLDVLRPLWTPRPATAAKVRSMLERTLDAATAEGKRRGDNPARWRGHLEHLLPARSTPVRHHPALPYAELPAFMAELRHCEGASIRALEWTILTVARENMTLGARGGEVSADAWTIPAERMKGPRAKRREHRVPLGPTVRSLLPAELDPSALLFPGAKRGRPLSNMAMDEVVRGKRPGYTVHGFRSTFRDWAGDQTDYAEEVIEAAMGHLTGTATRRAYRRGEAFERRRRLMEDWARFCLTPPSGSGSPSAAATPPG